MEVLTSCLIFSRLRNVLAGRPDKYKNNIVVL